MKKYKYKKIVSFNTKYKKGDTLECVKNVIFSDKILFQEGENYTIHHISYSECGIDKTTEYKPFYFMNEKHCFYSPDETFVTKEETHGASGMSGYGHVDEHFKKV